MVIDGASSGTGMVAACAPPAASIAISPIANFPAIISRGLIMPEAKDRYFMQRLAGADDGRWIRRKTGMVDRVQIILGLQAHGVEAAIDLAALARHGAVADPVAVKLHAGLGGRDFHGDAGARIVHHRRRTQGAGLALDH